MTAFSWNFDFWSSSAEDKEEMALSFQGRCVVPPVCTDTYLETLVPLI